MHSVDGMKGEEPDSLIDTLCASPRKWLSTTDTTPSLCQCLCVSVRGMAH